MRFTVCAAIAAAASAADIRSKFMGYLAEFGKSYITADEFTARLENFEQIESFITEHNASGANFTVGHNKFSDMSEQEKARYRGRLPQSQLKSQQEPVILDESLTYGSFDWRQRGAVNWIQDQAGCLSCYTFSSAACLEAAHQISTGRLVKFSEQQLVDCSQNFGNGGCNGGFQVNCFDYYKQNGAILEQNYPYQARDGNCMAGQMRNENVYAQYYQQVQQGSPSQIKAAIQRSVLSVAVQSDRQVFQQYHGGIFDSPDCGNYLDHAVNLVGYGEDYGQEYYILRNSWGTGWGEQGYMRIAITGDGDGVCGVQMDTQYVVSN